MRRKGKGKSACRAKGKRVYLSTTGDGKTNLRKWVGTVEGGRKLEEHFQNKKLRAQVGKCRSDEGAE